MAGSAAECPFSELNSSCRRTAELTGTPNLLRTMRCASLRHLDIRTRFATRAASEQLFILRYFCLEMITIFSMQLELQMGYRVVLHIDQKGRTRSASQVSDVRTRYDTRAGSEHRP
eukprot:4231510-Pyramimonas_sp.AAC.1